MGAFPSYNEPPKLNLNQNVHGTLDIGVCGQNNGEMMKPTNCSNNMSSNNTKGMSALISNLKIPDLPIDTCIPVGPTIGVKLTKDLNSKPNDTVSNFKLSTCSHEYKLQNQIPPNLQIDNTFINMNKDILTKMAMINNPSLTKPMFKPR